MRRTLLPLVFVVMAGSAHASPVVDARNDAFAPHPFHTWIDTVHGWDYTPTFSYALDGVNTRFRTADGRAVTIEVFDALPSSGGALLGATTYSVTLANVFQGGDFAAPIPLTAGHTYFVGFRNIGGLGVNYTIAPGHSQSSGAGGNLGLYTDLYPAPILQDGGILQFEGTVPEPASLLLAASAVIGLVVRRRR